MKPKFSFMGWEPSWPGVAVLGILALALVASEIWGEGVLITKIEAWLLPMLIGQFLPNPLKRSGKGDGSSIPPAATVTLLVLAIFITGCGGVTAQRVAHEALNTMTDVADPTYQMVLDTCDTFRNAIVERQGTTYEQDSAAMNQVDAICDPMVVGFETLRDSQLTARAFIDSGVEAGIGETVRSALALWDQLRLLIPQLGDLGKTSGGESGGES